MPLYYTVFLLGVFIFVFFSAADAYSCYRHIYNDSHSAWTFQATNTDDGNIYFLGNGCGVNGPCVLAPGEAMEIQYTYNGISGTAGTIQITDHTGIYRSYNYISAYMQCPITHHQGDTGAVALNNPANGDYTVVGSVWT